MNFIKPNLNSLPEQVDINTNDIKNLKSIIKFSYNTKKELETTTITIPITDTNAPQGTTSGWLYDSVGHLYSIKGGDDTNLLLEYYTNFRGLDGAQGVGIATIENVSYTDEVGYTITHCKVTLTNGTEEFFDVKAKQGSSGGGGVGVQTYTATSISDFANKLYELDYNKIINIELKITPFFNQDTMMEDTNAKTDTYQFNFSSGQLIDSLDTFEAKSLDLKNLKITKKDTYTQSSQTVKRIYLSSFDTSGNNSGYINSLGKFSIKNEYWATGSATIEYIIAEVTSGTPSNLKITYLE